VHQQRHAAVCPRRRATPTPLLDALVRRRALSDITLYHLHTAGPAPFVEPPHRERFFSVSVFAGAPVRQAIMAQAIEHIVDPFERFDVDVRLDAAP
jgi:hypothetical protein